MARRSRMSILKRQRELKKSEKAAHKRAKRHGVQIEGITEPRATFGLSDLLAGVNAEDGDEPGDDETASEDEVETRDSEDALERRE